MIVLPLNEIVELENKLLETPITEVFSSMWKLHLPFSGKVNTLEIINIIR